MNANVNTKFVKGTKLNVNFIVKGVIAGILPVVAVLCSLKLLFKWGFTSGHIFLAVVFILAMSPLVIVSSYSMFAKDEPFKYDDSNIDSVKLDSSAVENAHHSLVEVIAIVFCLVVVSIAIYKFM